MELKKPSKIKVPKQARSQKKVDQILQSDLRELSEQSKGQLPSMRKILKKLSINHSRFYDYFPSINTLYSKFFLRMANERILHQKKIIEDHPTDETVQQLMKKLTSYSFERFNEKPFRLSLVKKLYKIFDKSNDNQELEKLFDVLTAPHLKAAARDKTNTFKKMDELEFRDSIRAHAHYVKQPFLEDNNFAGSKEHQQKCYEMAVKLFAS